METPHTPGPWNLPLQWFDPANNPNAEADKRLADNAPDLLEALEDIPLHCSHATPHLLACWVCKARAAIAKARGRDGA